MISDSNVFSDEDIVILKHALDFVDEDLCMRWGPQNITREEYCNMVRKEFEILRNNSEFIKGINNE